MTVYVLVRRDQNEHGYIDTSITGIFRHEAVAKKAGRSSAGALDEGLLVESDVHGR